MNSIETFELSIPIKWRLIVLGRLQQPVAAYAF
jgi:hypothetical protein